MPKHRTLYVIRYALIHQCARLNLNVLLYCLCALIQGRAIRSQQLGFLQTDPLVMKRNGEAKYQHYMFTVSNQNATHQSLPLKKLAWFRKISQKYFIFAESD